MELLAFEHDLPPLQLNTLVDPLDAGQDDSWLETINFASPLQGGDMYAGAQRMYSAPVALAGGGYGCGGSAPMAICGRRAPDPYSEGVDSWESTQSLLATSVMMEEPLCAPSSLPTFYAAPPRMVPVEQAVPSCYRPTLLAHQQQPQHGAQRFNAPSEPAAQPSSCHPDLQAVWAQQEHHHHHYAQADIEGLHSSALQPHLPVQHMQELEPLSLLEEPRRGSAAQLAGSTDHAYYAQSTGHEGRGTSSAARAAIANTSSHGSLTRLDAAPYYGGQYQHASSALPHQMEEELSDSMTQVPGAQRGALPGGRGEEGAHSCWCGPCWPGCWACGEGSGLGAEVEKLPG